MFENARWADETQSVVIATVGGLVLQIPADMGNRHYREIVETGVPIAPPL